MYTFSENNNSPMSTRTRLRELGNLVFIELTSGLYYVDKDRMDVIGTKAYVDVRDVAGAMNRREKVVIFGAKGEMYSNTDFII